MSTTDNVETVLSQLTTLTPEAWEAARNFAAAADRDWSTMAIRRSAGRVASEAAAIAGRTADFKDAKRAAWATVPADVKGCANVAADAATAAVVRDVLEADVFDALVAPMVAVGVIFDQEA